jgi:hypothetical protein
MNRPQVYSLLALFVTVGCARRPLTVPYRSNTHAPYVELAIAGVSIRAEDSSFTLVPGERKIVPEALKMKA